MAGISGIAGAIFAWKSNRVRSVRNVLCLKEKWNDVKLFSFFEEFFLKKNVFEIVLLLLLFDNLIVIMY